MSKINVTVAGAAKTGKSTIATIIASALREYGVIVEYADDEVLCSHVKERVARLKGIRGLNVTVRTMQCRRES